MYKRQVLNLTPNAPDDTNSIPFTSRKPLAAKGALSINGKAEGEAQFTNVNLSFSETLDIGSDLGSPVSPEYKSPNRFNGKIDKVTVELAK